MEIQYQGEHLGYGVAGNILIILSFTTALLSTISYWYAIKSEGEISSPWLKLARTSFSIHAAGVIGVMVLIYYLIHGHYFEYYYIWQHSNTILPMKYMWACLWEGQEGSFLIWSFWHVVLSFILIRIGGKWESPVMFTIMLIQVFLASMLLGLEFNGIKIGSNPFVLLRDHPDFANLPFIKFPDYLSKIKDGRGLNPLLQNYWMVIHPPTLFLGFAATAIPFAFAIGGLITNRVKEWTAAALPWALFGISILGTGILMGGAWAYESLSFGGFWAWDPVENASLVPWLTLVGGTHVMLIYKKNKTSLTSAFVLVITTFLLVLYSTFLTRSGILGDTSVHAFTDLGMKGQLILYMVFFIGLSIYLMIRRRHEIKAPASEDDQLSSREFWMFMGMLILVISAVQVTITTSIPVINKVFGTKMAPPADAVDFYNSWQVPLAVIIALLAAIAQFFKWKKSDWKTVFRQLILSTVSAAILTILYELSFGFSRVQFTLLLFTSLWAITANLDIWIRVFKGKTNHSGASIAHIGIGMILLGALVSNTEKQIISQNKLAVDLGKDFPNKENILLYQGDTLSMGEYFVTYKGRKKDGINLFYEVEYFKQAEGNGLQKQFSLFPTVQLNERMGNVSEPSTKHFFNRDIYTHVTYAEMDDMKNEAENNSYKEGKKYELSVGDTFTTSNSLVVLEALDKEVDRKKLLLNETDVAVSARLRLMDVNKQIHYVNPVFVLRGNNYFSKPDVNELLGLRFNFNKIIPGENKVEIEVEEKESNSREFIIMKAIIFPHINILWIGCILMSIGTWIAILKRVKQLKTQD
ncbi:MAG: cytochrome c biogenesis protein CcsA [Bacteroidia bacterium]